MRRGVASGWLRHNMFRTPLDSVVTVIAAVVSAWIAYKTFNFIFVTGRWEVARVNLRLLLIGRFPETHVLRLAVTVVSLSAWAGLIAGIVHVRQVRAGRVNPARTRLSTARVFDLAERFWIPTIVILLLLTLTSTTGPWIGALSCMSMSPLDNLQTQISSSE